jgi:hypothetical protein
LAHSFRGLRLWFLGPMYLGRTTCSKNMWYRTVVTLRVDRKERERERERPRPIRDTAPKGTPPTDLLPPARPHILKFPQPSKNSATSWGPIF